MRTVSQHGVILPLLGQSQRLDADIAGHPAIEVPRPGPLSECGPDRMGPGDFRASTGRQVV